MHRPVSVAHSSFIEGSHMTKIRPQTNLKLKTKPKKLLVISRKLLLLRWNVFTWPYYGRHWLHLYDIYLIFTQFVHNFYAISTQFLRRVLKRPSTSLLRRRRRKTSTKASPETSINASGKASGSPTWTENIFPTVGKKSFWLVDVTNSFTSVIYECSQ